MNTKYNNLGDALNYSEERNSHDFYFQKLFKIQLA
jgi:hypothetical protein